MTRPGTAQVIHSLTGALHDDLPNHDCWPNIARRLLALGGDWPAVVDLAAMTTISQPAIVDAVTRLAEQTGQELEDLPTLGFWDTVCGLIARAWRLRVFDEDRAMYEMTTVWWRIRHLDRSSSRSLPIIWQGMRLSELTGFQDITEEAALLLVEADLLVPPYAVDGPLCKAVLDAIH